MIFVDPALVPNLIASFKWLSPAVRSKLCVDYPVGLRFNTILIAAGQGADVEGMQGYESLIGQGVYEEHVDAGLVKTKTAMMCECGMREGE